MTLSTGNSSKIRRIVRIRQMLFRWRIKARVTATHAPSDVPAGYIAVCVGPTRSRFIIRATYLNHPIFVNLLAEAEEEYGFCNHGPLAVPCDEEYFRELLRVMAQPKCCHVDVRSRNRESWPLLRDDPIY
ncbi:PREDICTED: indole-3-acetic acid-induced protein ARG7-like isoform X2 [Lupinus angustifolius]|uniref:indole-3-acetic acid-induced protein ARG7-like isoform X2 n=1 Tax=Lupinus angustifolius TaxID=3871 RepID=UPI00092F8C28|nr:PREDICTED: indole-3-acetic acid-induced protein ARG7-like isoform X2 [Lupinus angustifolius]